MSTDRDREGEKLVISVGAWRSGKKMEEEKNKLISELCDALETANPGWPDHYRSLLERAREATR